MINPYLTIIDFENNVSDYTGAPYVVAVDSCTNAIFLCLQWLKYSDRLPTTIEIPKLTYVSVPMQVIHSGSNPVFIEYDWQGRYKLDPTNIIDSARRFTLNMYEPDSLMCTSHHHTKILSCGKGGCILTDDEEAAAWLRRARFDGRAPHKAIQDDRINHLGWRMYMTPEQAVRGMMNLQHLPKENPDLPRSDYPDLSKMPVFNHKWL